MPIVTVNIKEGRTVEQKREMARRMTQVICETMKVEPAAVRIIVNEIGGTLVCDDPSMQVKPEA